MTTEVEKSDSLDSKTAAKYLKLYVADVDWEEQFKGLWSNYSKRYGNDTEIIKQRMKETIACTILLPTYDRSTLTDPPENLLFWCIKYRQFHEKDWWGLLKKIIEKDERIEKWRNECLSLGVVHPIEYSPITRQAFNWLFGKAKEADLVDDNNKSDYTRRFQNLVLAYGGAVICNIFMNHEKNIKKVLNWRTGYFFEREIFEVYDIEQVVKIKKAELKKTNPKLVKQIRHD